MATARVIPGMRGSPRETGSSMTNHRVHGGTPRAQVCPVLAVPCPGPGGAARRDAGCPGGAGVPARAAAAAGAAVPVAGGPAGGGARGAGRGCSGLAAHGEGPGRGNWCAKRCRAAGTMRRPRGCAGSWRRQLTCAGNRAASTRWGTCSRCRWPRAWPGTDRWTGPKGLLQYRTNGYFAHVSLWADTDRHRLRGRTGARLSDGSAGGLVVPRVPRRAGGRGPGCGGAVRVAADRPGTATAARPG
jgi:hypothetical protein